MSAYTIVITARSFAHANPQPLVMLEKAGCTVIRPRNEAERQKALAKADGIIAGLEPYNTETLDICKKLKVISRYGVGCDTINLDAARERGVKVAYTPGANSESVADLTMALMLAAARHVPRMDSMIKKGVLERPLGVEMWRKTLGVIGTGRIGKGVMKRAAGFEMRLLCYDIFRDEDFVLGMGGTYTDLDTLYARSDFITIHLPLTDETQGLISEAAFKKMKKTAVVVNAARGGILDEAALYKALKNGTIFAAGLDATVDEPPFGSPLGTLPNCILLPHAGATTIEASYNMGMMAAENALEVLRTGICRFLA
jgi:D-3-phosphoglycerate dehydrogenase